MAFVSSRSRERARRRKALLQRIGRWLLVLGIFIGIGYSSHRAGLILAESKVVALRRELADITRERDNARLARENAQAALAKANERIAELQTRYDTDVPRGDLATLLQLTRERLAAGITAVRVTDALRAVRPISVCDGRPVSKRFLLRTGPQPGPDDTMTFADGLISLSVTADIDDPARTMTAHFSRFGGAPSTASGPPPLRHAIVMETPASAEPAGRARKPGGQKKAVPRHRQV